ncbi:SulP family inorganic anion transporter [Vibrio sp. E150_018]
MPNYSRHDATKDGLATIIVTLMLIPQSLAYAMVAGLPPVVGLYASILPLIAYTLLGTSKTLAVGPVAVISLMTAEAVAPLFEMGSQGYITAAATLAFLSGIVLFLMSVLRLGFLTTFLSHPVLSGFMTASGILISIGQFKHILGVPLHGENVIQRLTNLILALPQTNFYTLLIGVSCLIALIYARKSLRPHLIKLGLSSELAGLTTSLALFLWRTSRPHIAVVGLIEGTQHFRNILRFNVIQSKTVLSLRIDESLYFANARYLEDQIPEYLEQYPQTQDLVLMLSGVNMVDASALESLMLIHDRLNESNIQLHLSEVKGPVMDNIHKSNFFERFKGKVYVSQYEAMADLDRSIFNH